MRDSTAGFAGAGCTQGATRMRSQSPDAVCADCCLPAPTLPSMTATHELVVPRSMPSMSPLPPAALDAAEMLHCRQHTQQTAHVA